MDKNIEYMDQNIEIIEECLTKLKNLRDKMVKQLPGDEQMDNLIRNMADNVKQIKQGVVG